MNTKKRARPRYAVCVNNTGYPASLELSKVYRVLPDVRAAKDRYLRVVDESGEDYLYPAEYFLVLSLPAAQVGTLSASLARQAG